MNNDEWYWDQKYMTWVFTGSKRIRKRDLTNKAEKNWVLGMRRNANTEKQAKLVEKITITREHLSSVPTLSFILSPLDSMHGNDISPSFDIGVPRTVRGRCVHST